MFNGCASKRYTHKRNFKSSGNTAFDSYKADVLNRLEQEQSDFQEFLVRLRDAKDKMEFDQFMDERETRAKDEDIIDVEEEKEKA